MLYHGRNKYDRIIAPEQLAWLYKDLRAPDPEIRSSSWPATCPS